jgi:dUTP pyrophosphatase
MKIKIKKLVNNAVIPTYAKDGDAGMDMTCTKINYTEDYVEYETGISMEIPKGYVGLIFPRSSNSKKDLLLKNSVGIIDSGYRGPINFRYAVVQHVSSNERYDGYKEYMVGDRIGQIMILPYPEIEFVESEELSNTERGEGGFGSSDKCEGCDSIGLCKP